MYFDLSITQEIRNVKNNPSISTTLISHTMSQRNRYWPFRCCHHSYLAASSTRRQIYKLLRLFSRVSRARLSNRGTPYAFCHRNQTDAYNLAILPQSFKHSSSCTQTPHSRSVYGTYPLPAWLNKRQRKRRIDSAPTGWTSTSPLWTRCWRESFRSTVPSATC